MKKHYLFIVVLCSILSVNVSAMSNENDRLCQQVSTTNSPFKGQWRYSNNAESEDDLIECRIVFYLNSPKQLFDVKAFGQYEMSTVAADMCTAFTKIVLLSGNKLVVKGFEGRYGDPANLSEWTIEYLPKEDKVKLIFDAENYMIFNRHKE